MRSIKELLQLMLNNKHLFIDGLCQWNRALCQNQLIDYKEYSTLEDYIDDNAPFFFTIKRSFWYRGYRYYWPKGDIKPRLKWINKHIKLNS